MGRERLRYENLLLPLALALVGCGGDSSALAPALPSTPKPASPASCSEAIIRDRDAVEKLVHSDWEIFDESGVKEQVEVFKAKHAGVVCSQANSEVLVTSSEVRNWENTISAREKKLFRESHDRARSDNEAKSPARLGASCEEFGDIAWGEFSNRFPRSALMSLHVYEYILYNSQSLGQRRKVFERVLREPMACISDRTQESFNEAAFQVSAHAFLRLPKVAIRKKMTEILSVFPGLTTPSVYLEDSAAAAPFFGILCNIPGDFAPCGDYAKAAIERLQPSYLGLGHEANGSALMLDLFYRYMNDPQAVRLLLKLTDRQITHRKNLEAGMPLTWNIRDDFFAVGKEEGLSEKEIEDHFFNLMGIYGTQGASLSLFLSLSDRAHVRDNPTMWALSYLGNVVSYLDAYARDGRMYSIPGRIHTTCMLGKPYHFWLVAYLTRTLKNEELAAHQSFSRQGLAKGVYLLGLLYEFHSKPTGRSTDRILTTHRHSIHNQSIRISMLTKALGIAYGLDPNHAKIDADEIFARNVNRDPFWYYDLAKTVDKLQKFFKRKGDVQTRAGRFNPYTAEGHLNALKVIQPWSLLQDTLEAAEKK